MKERIVEKEIVVEFKDLSVWLKILVVLGWFNVILLSASFLAGFMIG